MLEGNAQMTMNAREFFDIFVEVERMEKLLNDELSSVAGSVFVLGGEVAVMVCPTSDFLLFLLLRVFLVADLGGFEA